MIFSQMCQAAIKSVIYLASQPNEKLTIRSIAEEIQGNEHSLGKILQLLTRHGIIHSVKGIGGGFYMTEAQARQPIQRIVEIFDGMNELNRCVLGLNKCNSSKPCPIHEEYQYAKKIMLDILKQNHIKDLAQLVKDGTVNLTN